MNNETELGMQDLDTDEPHNSLPVLRISIEPLGGLTHVVVQLSGSEQACILTGLCQHDDTIDLFEGFMKAIAQTPAPIGDMLCNTFVGNVENVLRAAIRIGMDSAARVNVDIDKAIQPIH